MKLFTKYNRLNIATTILIFITGSITYYFLLQYILISQVDGSLQTERQEIIEYTTKHDHLPEVLPAKDQYTVYEKTDSATAAHKYKYSYAREDNSDDIDRKISFGIKAGGIYYLATVMEPLEQTEQLQRIIIWVTVGMIALILIVGFLINRKVLARLWAPFYFTVDSVKKYDLSSQAVIQLKRTNIDEFNLLNDSISSMTERMQQEYRSLKEFTSHAAHEIQTPLAVIRTKIDLLLQSEAMQQQNFLQLADIERAVHKLTRLYQSLLLLTKVENRQFTLDEEVDVSKIIWEKCNELTELAENKKITFNTHIQPLNIYFHQQLAEIMIGNLISNAIRYNKLGGHVNITLLDGELTISNTSLLPALDKEHLFKRFYRHIEAKEEGNGLGLSIVAQICDLGNFTVSYQYTHNEHLFNIKFK